METNAKHLASVVYGVPVSAETVPFGNWLDAEIGKRGWSRADLAVNTGVPRGTVSRWLNNQRVPDPPSCRKIAEALGLPDSVVLAMAGHGETAAPLGRIQMLGEMRRMVEAIDAFRSDVLKLLEEEVEIIERGVVVPVVGRVPADGIRFASTEGLEATVRVLEEDLRGARAPVALLVTGDCWRSIGILSGDHVIVDRAGGRTPANGQIVVVRLNGEYTMKRWCVIGNRIELRDGDDLSVATISPLDDVEVFGFYVTFKPTAPR